MCVKYMCVQKIIYIYKAQLKKIIYSTTTKHTETHRITLIFLRLTYLNIRGRFFQPLMGYRKDKFTQLDNFITKQGHTYFST